VTIAVFENPSDAAGQVFNRIGLRQITGFPVFHQIE